MKIMFLGTGAGSSLGSKRMMSSLLFIHQNKSIVFDLGAGAFMRLEDLGYLDKISEIYITHLHIDHISGILDYIVHRKVFSGSTITIYSPKGLDKVLSSFKEVGNNLTYNLFEFNKGIYVKENGLEIYSINACHSIPAFSYVIQANGKKIIYTGDTAEPCEEIINEAKNANLIIHEMTCIDNCKKWGHTSFTDLTTYFSKDLLERVIVTHIPSQLEDVIRSQNIDKVIKVAYDGLVLTL